MGTFFLGLSVALGAPNLKEKEKPASLAGEWRIEQCTVGAKPSPAGWNNRWVFRDDGSRSIQNGAGKEIVSGTYTTEKDGALDLDASGAGGAYLCRYRLDGDTLILNVGWQKAPRPDALESPPDSQCTLYVMKRVKAKD